MSVTSHMIEISPVSHYIWLRREGCSPKQAASVTIARFTKVTKDDKEYKRRMRQINNWSKRNGKSTAPQEV